MSEQKERQALQVTAWLENGKLNVNINGNMGVAQAIAALEIAKFKLMSNEMNRRDPMIQIPGMLRGDLKRVPA